VAAALGAAGTGRADPGTDVRVTLLVREQCAESGPAEETDSRFSVQVEAQGAAVRGARAIGLSVGDLQVDIVLRNGRFQGPVAGAAARVRGSAFVSGSTLHASFSGRSRDGQGSVFGAEVLSAVRSADFRNGVATDLRTASLSVDGTEVPIAVAFTGRSASTGGGDDPSYRVHLSAAGLSAASRGRPVVQFVPSFPGDRWMGRARGHVLAVGFAPQVSIAVGDGAFQPVVPLDAECLDLGGGDVAGDGLRTLSLDGTTAWHVRVDSATAAPPGPQAITLRAETRASRVATATRNVEVPEFAAAQSLDASEQVLEIRSGGELWTWGRNAHGQVGDATTSSRSVPMMLPAPATAVSVAAGPTLSVAADAAGTVWRWGDWRPEGATASRGASSLIPVVVLGAPKSVAVAAGTDHVVALGASGDVVTFGANAHGQLGDGTRRTRLSIPALVGGLSDVVAVAAAPGQSFALDARGDLWIWGRDVDGPGVDALEPVRVHGLPQVTAVSAGGEIVVLAANGTVWTLDRPDVIEPTTFAGQAAVTVRQVPNLYGVVAVDAGDSHSLALRNDGTVWGWGTNANGELGDGTSSASSLPLRVRDLTGCVAICAGTNLSLAVRSDGSVWGWGRIAGQPGVVGWREGGRGVYPQLVER
jgi:alpha-tubulin suppressor-like RCC1 family protein